jgi:hypothetical protein
MLFDILRSILTAVADHLPRRVIMREDGDRSLPYLERYYVCGDPTALKYFPPGQDAPRWWQRPLTWLPLVYLHRFRRDDEDVELHNHPWAAVSLILVGGYYEERREEIAHADLTTEYVVRRYERKPFTLNRLRPDTFHRVDLREHDAWTLIFVGEKVQSWGFWHPRTWEFIPWREHVRRKAAEPKSNARGGRA